MGEAWWKTKVGVKLPIPAANVLIVRIAKKAKLKKDWGVNVLCLMCVSRLYLFLFLEEQCSHAAHFTLLLYKDLEVLVDDGDSQEDSCSWTNSTQKISHDRQSSYTETTESSRCRDVPVDTNKQ